MKPSGTVEVALRLMTGVPIGDTWGRHRRGQGSVTTETEAGRHSHSPGAQSPQGRAGQGGLSPAAFGGSTAQGHLNGGLLAPEPEKDKFLLFQAPRFVVGEIAAPGLTQWGHDK